VAAAVQAISSNNTRKGMDSRSLMDPRLEGLIMGRRSSMDVMDAVSAMDVMGAVNVVADMVVGVMTGS
jgi:hypothetical protein